MWGSCQVRVGHSFSLKYASIPTARLPCEFWSIYNFCHRQEDGNGITIYASLEQLNAKRVVSQTPVTKRRRPVAVTGSRSAIQLRGLSHYVAHVLVDVSIFSWCVPIVMCNSECGAGQASKFPRVG